MSFQNTEERNVVLTGEAFFDVESNKEKAFVVRTGDIDVRVHGTSFNVSAYEEDQDVTVALVEGKVSLEKDKGGVSVPLAELRPNEVVSYNRKNESVTSITDMKMNQFIGWKEGLIVFYGDSIKDVSARLEKWYSVDIEIDPALSDYRFTATIQNESLEQVLDLLCLSSPIKYKIIPAQLNEDKTFTNRKVELIKKR